MNSHDPKPEDRSAATEEVHPHDFAVELARQVYADLDGVLFEAHDAADEALAVVTAAVAVGGERGRGLWLLLRAALSAYRRLRFGDGEGFPPPHDNDVFDALSRLCPQAAGDATSWGTRGRALAAAISAAEGDREALHPALAAAVFRLYDGLRSDDELLGGRGLLELRTMLAHVDAAAGLPAAELVAVWRPDHFHDEFLRYLAAAQAGSADVQQAVATLRQDGRITALVTREVHPVEHAREALSAGREGTVTRIEALLDFLQALRQSADPLGRAASDSEGVFTALITAAATAPLVAGSGFAYPALAQICRYNLRLLQSTAGAPRQAH